MNKRQKKKYTDRVRSLVFEVDIFTQDQKWHTDMYPEAIRLNAKMFRRCWNWAARNDLFRLSVESPQDLSPKRWYNLAMVYSWNERPCAYCVEWEEKNA